MSASLPQDLEPNIIAAKLKALFESIQLPKDFYKAFESGIKNEADMYKEIVGFVKTHQEETAKTLDTNINKLENNLNQLKYDTDENFDRLKKEATPEILQRHFNAAPSQR